MNEKLLVNKEMCMEGISEGEELSVCKLIRDGAHHLTLFVYKPLTVADFYRTMLVPNFNVQRKCAASYFTSPETQPPVS